MNRRRIFIGAGPCVDRRPGAVSSHPALPAQYRRLFLPAPADFGGVHLSLPGGGRQAHCLHCRDADYQKLPLEDWRPPLDQPGWYYTCHKHYDG